MSFEKTLGALLGADDNTEVELVQVADPGETPTLEIRLRRHCGDLGWQTQRRIRLAPGQIANLRDALNLMDQDARDTRIAGRPSQSHPDVVQLATLRQANA